ncbi:MAG: TfoX/Sxy family protein [Reichenbachiella sp.]|uniref:TfoX/Sxy family protein n=1 Tax=Reichenbachiella sp. TaxID=2184521 RepID=UPI0032679929
MGTKGDKITNESSLTAALILEKLISIDGLSSKKMFGGYGIFNDGKMFGMVGSKGQAYLKVDDSNKAQFEKAGAKPHSKMPYLSIPDDILADQEKLVHWAETSIEITK